MKAEIHEFVKTHERDVALFILVVLLALVFLTALYLFSNEDKFVKVDGLI